MSDETLLKELGQRIARLRLERNLSQAQLAEQAGISKRTLERLEAGAAATQLKRGRAEAIAEEVITAVGNWPRFASEAGVPEDRCRQIQASHRLTLLRRDNP